MVYEARCLTCEQEAQEQVEQQDLDEKQKQEEKNKIKLYKYIGETSRSCFERGWEHANDMAQLKTSSHMLKHAIQKHPEQDMGEVQFGMKIIKTCQSSFERQIYESVMIQQERKSHHILNSRTEFNRCSLPRIITQVGEQVYENYSKEIQQEKEQEEKLEKLITNLRKKKNKARLMPSKDENLGTKRRKIDEQNYISITEIWGRPAKTTSTKNKAEHQLEKPEANKKRKTKHEAQQENPKFDHPQDIKLELDPPEHKMEQENLEKPVIQTGPGWQEPVDWDKRLEEHRKRIVKEEQERNSRLEHQEKKTKSWELYRLCKNYLEENNSK